MITLQNVQAQVAHVASIAHDDEAAHAAEDALHQLVLHAIANGECPQPQECAREALKTRQIEFARHCA